MGHRAHRTTYAQRFIVAISRSHPLCWPHSTREGVG